MMKMSPMKVNNYTYHILRYAYYMLCLSGVIWQICVISVEYFKFEVSKNMNIFTPEEMIEKDIRNLYVCFMNAELIDISTLQKMYPDITYIPLSVRFNHTIGVHEVFRLKNNLYPEMFIFGPTFCYQFQNENIIRFKKDIFFRMEYFHLSVGDANYEFDNKRLINVPIIKGRNGNNKSHVYLLQSSSYQISKLTSPFTDHCFDYPKHGYVNRFDALNSCASQPGAVYTLGTILKYDKYKHSDAINHINMYDNKKCWKRYPKVNCDIKFYLSKVSWNTKTKYNPFIYIEKDIDASFSVISTPRINIIDLVTYILGALGSWIGFSFVAVNPVTHFMAIKGDANHRDANSQDRYDRILIAKVSCQGMKISELEMSNKSLQTEMKELKQFINQFIDGQNVEQINESHIKTTIPKEHNQQTNTVSIMSTTSRTFQAMGQFTSEMNRNLWSFLQICPRNVPSNIDLKGKNYIVTGGNRGFGRGVTLELVARGAHVIIAARDAVAAKGVEADASRLYPSAPKVSFQELDLTSFDSIKTFARGVKTIFGDRKHLSGLVNNAGLWSGEQKLIEARDGQPEMEASWAVNVFGLALLTHELEYCFEEGARVVNVGSLAHLAASSVNIFDPFSKIRTFDWITNYAKSKLASMLYTKQLSKQLIKKKIFVYSVDPGISQTELSAKLGTVARLAMESFLGRPFMRAPIDGSRSILYPLTINTDLYDPKSWYYCDGAPKATGPQLDDEKQERAVWKMVHNMIGVHQIPEFII